ncbi:acylamino-acid-releasing enzyme-like isoform X1 [Hibiscus syriacus]|uniref:Acylamino-acid-releasing enzyme-like isoform X1 n=1 Tax=Hibiscus syriacus TaxID=106335 RepID=A0A6A2WJM3_HIBSY|nr:acylamino-acid-releasing enzyme-like isoform X1 [Hibiscus syriacus]
MEGPQVARQTSELPISSPPVLEKDRSLGFLPIPFERKAYETSHNLPPFQSLVEFSAHAAEAADAIHKARELSPQGINQDGTTWWMETGVEQRPDGVICRWTMIRGVSVDQAVDWQEKYWEASDEFGYKELGSEKAGRDVFGNVWSEKWRESMLQENGLAHLEKTADKWGKNAEGAEWQEKWWEHYDASGKSEKWADKWCSIVPNTPLEAGHAHVWHERWGEQYDGYGGSVKYTDKWAERCEGDGETGWQGKHGDRWNRTWGEQHNGSGWVHKYGKSSSGEHWDTHVEQETWYERFPHYGFYHCFDNSVQLWEVKKPSEMSE